LPLSFTSLPPLPLPLPPPPPPLQSDGPAAAAAAAPVALFAPGLFGASGEKKTESLHYCESSNGSKASKLRVAARYA
jgi:hypothetical protein